MHSFAPIRFAVASFALSASLGAQSPQATPQAPTQVSSTLPATAPTAPAPPLTPSQRPPTRAQITYTGGTLSVSANNSSLNQILRQISSDTGMKIIGGVTDERVFGQYGPATPDQVLSALLDGTGSNMLIVHRDGDAPAELVLTPRQGGATPPNPNAIANDERPEPQGPPPIQADQSQPAPAPAPNVPPVTPAANPGTPAGNPPTDGSQPDSPNGVKTPQQIYEQLQRMRQQQQQPPQQQQPTQPQ
jgi:hypothetical protein